MFPLTPPLGTFSLLPLSALITPTFHTRLLGGLLFHVCIVTCILTALLSTQNYLPSDITTSHTFLQYKYLSPMESHQFSCLGLFLLLMSPECVLVIKEGADHRSLNTRSVPRSIQKPPCGSITRKANEPRGGTNAPKNASF